MILRVVHCIPTFDNPSTIEQVVHDALSLTELSVLVVDDGSSRPVSELLRSPVCRAAIESGRLNILRWERNQGKGVALRAGVRWAVERGFTHLLSIDGDGQHLVRETALLIEKAVKNPWDLIIGRRRFGGNGQVPGISKFGRNFSNFWVGYQTGLVVEDSQSGFRLYPLFHVQGCRFWTKRYDFEIEVLIRLLWKGVQVQEVDIDVYYPPPDSRVSHFKKFKDNFRISVLNTLLVAVSLLRLNLSPRKSGVALGLGLFIGSSPFFGLHMVFALALAFLLRLNAVLTVVGTQISIPPVAVFLVPFEILIGRRILHAGGNPPGFHNFAEVLRFARESALQWFAGWIVFGTVIGLIGGFLAWALIRRKRRPNWTGRTRGGRFGNGFLKLILRWFGLRAGYFCLLFIVPYFYLFAPRARRSSNEYWRAIDASANWLKRQRRILSQMYSFGQILMDRVYQSFHSTNKFETNPIGLEHLLSRLRAKKPFILAGAHVGGWDLAPMFLKADGLSDTFHIIHYQSKDFSFEQVVNGANAEGLVADDDPIFAIKEILEAGQPLGWMADRPSNANFELVLFFGRLFPVDVRAFRIGALCGADVVFAFVFKRSTKTYDICISPAHIADLPRPRQSLMIAQEYARALEENLRRYPEQWFNFFPAFSVRPQPPPGAPEGIERNSLWQEWRKPPMPESELALVARRNAEP